MENKSRKNSLLNFIEEAKEKIIHSILQSEPKIRSFKSYFYVCEVSSIGIRLICNSTKFFGSFSFFFFFVIKYRQAIIEMPMLENHHYADNQNSFEVPRESVELERIIGYGAFGVVCHGRVYNLHGRSGWMHVAIKTLRPENMNNDDEPDEYERERKYEIRKDFLDEINLMKSLPRHPNVLTLLGCCTQDVEKPVYMVLEYVGNGDLVS